VWLRGIGLPEGMMMRIGSCSVLRGIQAWRRLGGLLYYDHYLCSMEGVIASNRVWLRNIYV